MPHPEFQAHVLPPLLHHFRQLYGDGEVRLFRAPARINILGEHIDYVSYLPTASLPFGSHEHAMVLLFRANESGQVRGASMDERFTPFSFPASEGQTAGQSWLEYLYSRPTPAPHWSNYVKGAVCFAAQKHSLPTARGFDFLIHSSIPPQGGSSSSSALVVLAGTAFRQVNYIAYSPAQLAQDSAQAEWYVGTRGGALDHTTICMAQRHHAVHLRYADHRVALVPLPDKRFRWVTFFTHAADKGREIMLAYNERAAVSRLLIPAIIESWQTQEPNLYATWCDAVDFWKAGVRPLDLVQSLLGHLLPTALSLTEVSKLYPAAFEQCQRAFPALVQERADRPLKLRDRALHHVTEIARVEQAVKLLRGADKPEARMRQLGQMLNASHASLRDLYEVSTPQVNQLWDVLTADSQVRGARLIGGGFGGNVLALTAADNVAALLARVQQEYYAPQQRDCLVEGAVMVSTPGEGLSELRLSEVNPKN
jgi:N-acetylgalactosamine kinase